MEDCVWRKFTKLVAVVDIILCAPSAIVLRWTLDFIFILFCRPGSVWNKDGSCKLATIPNQNWVGLAYSVVILFAIATLGAIFLQFLADSELRKAVNIKTHPQDAMQSARFFRNVKVVLLVVAVAGNLWKVNIWSLVLNIVWPCISLFIVQVYIEALVTILHSPA